MSKVNTLNRYNTPTPNVLNNLNTDVGLSVLKRLRFEFGNKKPKLYRELAIINEVVKVNGDSDFRNEILSLALPKIKKL